MENRFGIEAAILLHVIGEGNDSPTFEEPSPEYTNATVAEARRLIATIKAAMARLESIVGPVTQADTGATTVRVDRALGVCVDGRPVQLRPLPHTLLILLLRHPEGVLSKEMDAFRDELEDIYCRISPTRSREEVHLTIGRLLDPYSNSLETQKWRLNTSLAAQVPGLLVTGRRGEKKRIPIEGTRVIFEESE